MDYLADTRVKVGEHEQMRVDKIVDIYKESVDFTCPISGNIRRYDHSPYYYLTINYRHCDPEFSKWKYMTKHCNFQRDEATRTINEISPLTPAFSTFEVIMDVTSLNGRYRAKLLLIELIPYKDRQQILEVWKGDKHLKTFEVNKIDAHGTICVDSCFKSMHWSTIGEQDKLVYVANDSKPKPRNFFSSPDPEPSTSTAKKQGYHNTELISKAYKHRYHWGEATNETIHTCIGVVDAGNDCKINVIKGEFQTLTGPVFVDNNTKLACVGVDTGARKFGLIYCNNRPSNILLFTIESGANVCVDNLFTIEDNMSIHDLRVDHTGNKLLFAANPMYGAHHQPSALYVSDLTERDFTTVRPLEAKRICKDTLFNLASQGITQHCFSDDNRHIFISVEEKMMNKLLRINLQTHEIDQFKTPTQAFEIYDVCHNHILIAGSSIDQRPTVYFSSLDRLDRWSTTQDEIWIDNSIQFDYEEMLDKHENLTLSAVYIRPVSPANPVKQLPTVVMVHGGPHATFLLNYSPAIYLYNKLNLRVLLLNYRGSYSYDKRHNNSLLGNIGYGDVNDCLNMVLFFREKFQLNMDKLAIQGGSHGGFLAAHLSTQKEVKFNCAIIRNPVIDLYSMYVTSDIPDWVLAEALNSDQVDMNLTSEMIDTLYSKSPSGKQMSVRTPTLLMLGKADKRVPMSQGLLWATALRRRNVDVEVRSYDDKHDLYKLDVYSDSTICSALFLLKYLYN